MVTKDWVFLLLTLPPAMLWFAALAATLRMVSTLRILAHEPLIRRSPPRVSVVSPACNEACGIEASVRSWRAQSDVDLQIVCVNDRSTDDTGVILDRLAAGELRLCVVHNRELPTGWLGKVFALHLGVVRAVGDWLLFADADVRLDASALARAVGYAEAGGLDLLSVYPEIESAGFWGDVAWSGLGAGAGLAGLWRSRDPDSPRAFAAGAFILIRRAAFDATPGFAWLKLEVADDQGLALLLKSHGYRCDIVNGRGLVRLTWYRSLRDMVVKSQKNWFGIAGRFSLARCVGLAVLICAVALAPLAMALPNARPALFAVPIASQLALLTTSLVHAKWTARPLAPAVLAPIGLFFVAFMLVRAGVVGWRRGGIEWRGVLYPASLLRGVQKFRM